MGFRIFSHPRMLGLLTIALASGCAIPESADGPTALAAKGGNGGPTPVVDATVPDQAPQETTLDVRVLGSNFDNGSKAEFLLKRKVTPKVKTNSTTFVTEGELVANITIAADADVASYDVQVTALGGRKGIGIERFAVIQKATPGTFPVSDILSAPTGADGYFGDDQGSYPNIMDTQNTTSLTAQCSQNRSIVLQLPTSWADLVVPGAQGHCDTKLDLNQLTACPEGTSCPLGTTGHDATTHYALDVNYYFYVLAPKPHGKGVTQTEYDVVWTDVTYRVTRWAGVPNGTPCEWQVTGGTAEFWTGNPTAESKVGGNEAMALSVRVSRTDGGCA